MNIFDCALKMERDAKVHYEELAKAAPVPELRNLFGMLAAAETEHYDSLMKMKEDPSAAGAEFKALKEAACAFRPLLDKRDVIAGMKGDEDGYQHVVKEEEDSVRLYEDLLAKAEDERTRNLLRALIEEEKRHLSIIENIYSFIEEPHTYLAWGEFSNLKEY